MCISRARILNSFALLGFLILDPAVTLIFHQNELVIMLFPDF